MKSIRIKNIHNIIIAQLNINSLRNKIDSLAKSVISNIDILLITETKVDDSFPVTQFLIHGFGTPYRIDRNSNGGGIILYIREAIPSILLTDLFLLEKIEGMFVEININKVKWLISCSYNPQKVTIKNHLYIIGKHLNSYSSQYDNFIIIGDFNSEPTENNMTDFCDLYNVRNIIKGPTCFKNPEKPSCIDLLLTNKKKSFKTTHIIETGYLTFTR